MHLQEGWRKSSINDSPKINSLAGILYGRQYSDHVQFSFVLHQAGHGIGREHACSQGQIGVDDCCELSEAGVSDGWVKTGPEHPQKDRPCRWEQLMYPKHARYIS